MGGIKSRRGRTSVDGRLSKVSRAQKRELNRLISEEWRISWGAEMASVGT